MVRKTLDSPPFNISPKALLDITEITRLVGQYEGLMAPTPQPTLRRLNKTKTIQSTLSIEGNTLNESQITAILNGETVKGPAREILEATNAIKVYEQMKKLSVTKEKDFLKAHKILMDGLVERAGKYRQSGVGIIHGAKITHVAPPHQQVPHLMHSLFSFLKTDKLTHPLVKACVFHYEVEFIHPFSDGNGRMGRLWQHAIMVHFNPVFEYVPFESLIRDHQKGYYGVLKACDKAGDATAFVDFSVNLILMSLTQFLKELRVSPVDSPNRLELAKEAFKSKEFTRKEYLLLFKTLSTATASRDLKLAVQNKILKRFGDKALARYRFR